MNLEFQINRNICITLQSSWLDVRLCYCSINLITLKRFLLKMQRFLSIRIPSKSLIRSHGCANWFSIIRSKDRQVRIVMKCVPFAVDIIMDAHLVSKLKYTTTTKTKDVNLWRWNSWWRLHNCSRSASSAQALFILTGLVHMQYLRCLMPFDYRQTIKCHNAERSTHLISCSNYFISSRLPFYHIAHWPLVATKMKKKKTNKKTHSNRSNRSKHLEARKWQHGT